MEGKEKGEPCKEERNVSERRSKLEILLTVLGAVKSGIDKPTRIIYAANMSWNPTQKVLKKLVSEGHLEVVEEPSVQRAKKRYIITEKGASVLRYFRGVDELINL
jgi:predicted transcriptional regulator